MIYNFNIYVKFFNSIIFSSKLFIKITNQNRNNLSKIIIFLNHYKITIKITKYFMILFSQTTIETLQIIIKSGNDRK